MVLLAPLVLIFVYESDLRDRGESSSEGVTVGIAVLIRATARRFMRSASSGLMRTTVGALGRASARAAVRRGVKAAMRVVASSLVRRDEPEEVEVSERSEKPGSAVAALSIGFVALALSFYGVLQVASEEARNLVLRGGQLGVVEASVLAGVPLLVYAGFHNALGRVFGVKISYSTELDGLLLQGYFTGAGSFLPMTTDVEYAGTANSKSNLAVVSLLLMLVVHVALVLIGGSVGSDRMEFLGTLFLVYAFIYVFPISPLEGQFVWRRSKLLWLSVALPILGAFLFLMPREFAEVL